MFLALVTVMALVWANSPLSESYFELWHQEVGFDVGPASMHMNLHHWINDGLMVIFFFVVGLEVRQEFAHGSLRDRSRAQLAVMAGVAGVALPALVYVLVVSVSGGSGLGGWGAEAQRVKLGSELQRAQSGDTLYVLDEPTSGLHCADTNRLVAHLQSLVDAGNTVVMVELDMRVIAQADHVIDLGPGAGGDGGQVVAAGTPAEVAGSSTSASARYLATALEEAAAVSRVDTVVA